MTDFWALRFGKIWEGFRAEHFSFWMICGYLFVEYVRPQSIYPVVAFLPWGQIFLLGAFLGWLTDGRAKWVSAPSNKWIIIFLVIMVVAIFLAQYPDFSKLHFIDFFIWVVVYFNIILVVSTRRRFYIFLLIFLFSTFKLSFSGARIWAMRGFSFDDFGLQGPPGYFENSGELAIQMLVYSPVAYQLFVHISPWLTKWKKIMMVLMPVTGVMTVLGASSRGSQIGMAFQIYLLFLKGKFSFKSLVVTSLIGSVTYIAIPEEGRERLAHTGHDKTSEQRLVYWKRGIEIIGDHPILGVGLFNFSPYFDEHYSGDIGYKRAELPHNIFIQIGCDAGLLGLAVYFILIYQFFAANRSVRRSAAALGGEGDFYFGISKGLDVGMWGFLIAGQFVTVGYYPFMWVNLAFGAALQNIAQKDAKALLTKR